jgi:surface protein
MKSINLKITNNTSLEQEISILGIIPNPNSANDSNILYSFDLSTQSFVLVNSVNITYASTSNPTPTTSTASVLTQNIQGVVDALNTLGIGLFNFSGTTIYVSSNIYTYSNITIGFPFVSTWNTANTSGGSSASNQVTLPLFSSGSYNFIVDWGDGNIDTITAWNQAEVTHTYSSSGTYTISIGGECNGFRFNDGGDKLKILSVSTWGNFELIGNLGRQFYGCTNLDLTSVSDVLNFGNCTNCELMFSGYNFSTINNINSWDVSNVTNMSFMFSDAILFNQNLNSWNVSSVTDMSFMFYNANSFNGNIISWNVTNVTNMNSLFLNATPFNQNIGSWNVSSVTDMVNMFSATAFNQNIGAWNVSSVINMSTIFGGATAFNQNISSWNVSNVANMNNMFLSATSFNQNIGAWDVSSVTSMVNMFNGATAFNQDIGAWDISNVTNFTNFMLGKSFTNYSSANLDAIYNNWSLLSVQPSININFGTIKYTAGGSAGKLVLTSAPNNWTITDGGI